MRDMLNGAHGYTLHKYAGSRTFEDRYIRKRYTILMSYSESLPGHAVTHNPIIEPVGSDFYKPFMMLEQLQPRPSEAKYFNDIYKKETIDVEFNFQILDFFRVAHLQDMWITEIDSICSDPYSLEPQPVKKDGSVRRIGLGPWFVITVVVLQLLSNILGIFCLIKRSTTSLL